MLNELFTGQASLGENLLPGRHRTGVFLRAQPHDTCAEGNAFHRPLEVLVRERRALGPGFQAAETLGKTGETDASPLGDVKERRQGAIGCLPTALDGHKGAVQVLHLGSQEDALTNKVRHRPDDSFKRHCQPNTRRHLQGLRPGTGRALRPLHGLTSLIDGVRRIVELRIELLRGLGNVDEGLTGLIELGIELLEALAGLLRPLRESP